AAIKQELISKYGLPFRVWRTEGMALWYFCIDETTATRTYTHSLEDGMTEHASLSWEIINGELVISGAWNETFTTNIEENTVTSQTDGAIYKLLKEQE
ncbi:MAG: hypothetical protein IJ386_00475, partial [Clostridia bacterium]|nr:hypothetical protein [Clostridia bacterium]